MRPGGGLRGWLRGWLGGEGSIFLRRVHIDGQQGIGHGDGFDEVSMGAFDLACIAGDRSLKKRFNKLRAGQQRMAVFAIFLRRHAPFSTGEGPIEGRAQVLQASRTQRGTVHERDHGGIDAQSENCAQTNLERAELSALGLGVWHHQVRRRRQSTGARLRAFFPATTTMASVNGLRDWIAAESKVWHRSGRRPWKQRFVGSHARGGACREDDAADAVQAAAWRNDSRRRACANGSEPGSPQQALAGKVLDWLRGGMVLKKPAHMRQRPLDSAANADKLGQDGDGNFFRSDGADIEADRRVHAIEQLRLQTFSGQFAKNGDGFSF